MPVKLVSLPHLRLLNSSSGLVSRIIMKTNQSLARVNPVFTRVFSHKLKYQPFSSSKKLGFSNSITTAKHHLRFSTRASKHASEIRSAKSLIEDEAELSDWVSELKSDSFKKSRLYSESDDGGTDGRGGRGSAMKRQQDSDFDGYDAGYGNRGRRGGGGRDSFDGRERGKRGFGGEFGRREEGFVSRRENGFENGKERRSSGNSRGLGRIGGAAERRNDGVSCDLNKGKGNWGSFGSFPKGKEPYVCDRSREDEGFVSKRRDDSFRGGGLGELGRGGLRRGGKSIGSRSLMMSDHDALDQDDDEDDGEEPQKNLLNNFRELISDDDDEEEDEEDEDEGEDGDDDDGVLGKGNELPNSPRRSPDGSESYLSETRYIA